MKQLVKLISEKNYTEADKELEKTFPAIMEQKLFEMKKAIAAKMSEGKMGIVGPTRSEKLASGVLEEDDLEEMDMSREKPSPDVEDRRGMKDPNWFMKNKSVYPNAHGAPKPKQTQTQTVNSSEKGDLKENDNSNSEELDEARINIVKARIRGGKVQRRKKVSNVPGMTMRGGQLKRMSAAERRRRKMGARRGKIKRMSKMSRALMKRKRSLQKRKSLGI